MSSLKDRVALVSAASKGLGFATAKVLAQEGCKVAICSRKKGQITSASEAIMKETGNRNVLPLVADMTSESDINMLVDKTQQTFGDVEILAYNAGPPKPGAFMELSDDDWKTGINLLLMSAVWLSRKVIPSMAEKGFGRLIYIASYTLKQPVRNLVLSNVVRLSVAGLSKTLSQEYGGKGITSNVVLPGNILTDRQKQLIEDTVKRTGMSFEQATRERVKDVPSARIGLPEEIGHLVAFLASDKGSYINGTMIAVDGGLTQSVY